VGDFSPVLCKVKARAVLRRVARNARFLAHFGHVHLERAFGVSAATTVARLATDLLKARSLFESEPRFGFHARHVASNTLRVGVALDAFKGVVRVKVLCG
jgi:hypothetical protein